MTHVNLSRRQLLTASAASAALMAGGRASQAAIEADTSGYVYEVTRTNAEWRAMLTDPEFQILREGATEIPKTSPLWNEERPGTYGCKGCALEVYDGDWKVILDKGWAFFRHGQPNAVLTGIDWPDGSGMADEFRVLAAMETHCRRCGSHLGHVFVIDGELLHCINGTSLTFQPTA